MTRARLQNVARKPTCSIKVGFGDDLPQKVVQKAWDEAEAADLCLALGSSITASQLIVSFLVFAWWCSEGCICAL